MKNLMFLLLSFTLVGVPAAWADEADLFVCPAVPEPVINLDHGSRYIDDDDSRSEFDEASNDDVNTQLKPIDSFISALVVIANRAVSNEADRSAASQCVLSSLAVWAQSDALSNLETMNANLATPSRIAGFAFAYGQIKPFLVPNNDTALVETWLGKRAEATVAYFDKDAPPMASQNNLRAWAALAVARVGLIVEDENMLDWADSSVRLVVCQTASDGSLKMEMTRQNRALHYQLHAVAPLVVTAALLESSGNDLFRACDMAIHKTVYFVLDAFDDPEMVEKLTGYPQTYFDGSDELQSFELAWATSYLTLFYAPRLRDFVADYGTLSNSKLGGQQSLVWGVESKL